MLVGVGCMSVFTGVWIAVHCPHNRYRSHLQATVQSPTSGAERSTSVCERI